MSDRTTALTRELHERGLRKKLAKQIAKQVTAAGGGAGAEPPAKVRAAAEALRRLATEVETEAVATQEGSRGEGSDASESAPPAHLRARPRARRN